MRGCERGCVKGVHVFFFFPACMFFPCPTKMYSFCCIYVCSYERRLREGVHTSIFECHFSGVSTIATCCSVLQCVAVCCSVLQCVVVFFGGLGGAGLYSLGEGVREKEGG